MYTGSKQPEIVLEDTSKIEVQELVAVICENYSKEPVIGKCTQISEDYVEVVWMKGT